MEVDIIDSQETHAKPGDIGVNSSTKAIVLFAENSTVGEGIVLQAGSGSFPIGYRNSFNISAFNKFKGSIILKQ